MFMLQEEKSNQQLHSVVNPIRYKHGLARHAHWRHSGMSCPESYQPLYYSKPALQDHNVEFTPDTVKEAKNSCLIDHRPPAKNLLQSFCQIDVELNTFLKTYLHTQPLLLHFSAIIRETERPTTGHCAEKRDCGIPCCKRKLSVIPTLLKAQRSMSKKGKKDSLKGSESVGKLQQNCVLDTTEQLHV